MREVKVCKYHLIAESCSWVVHRTRSIRRPFHRGYIERKKPRLQTALANPKTCDTPEYVGTILLSGRAWRGWTNDDGDEKGCELDVSKVLALVCGGPSISGKAEHRYYDKIFTDRNRRGKEFSASTAVVPAAVSRM